MVGQFKKAYMHNRPIATFLTHLQEFKKRPFNKKKQSGEGGGGRGVEDILYYGISRGSYQGNSLWNFQGLIKNQVEFPGQR